MKNTSFCPGKTWLDTDGKRIQAHGGSVMFHDGKYYWYGENKEYTDGINGIWTCGVRCYSSFDLYNWKDEGLIIKPETNRKSSLNPHTAMLDRPHILYNEQTKQFVCYMKIMRRDGSQSLTICVANDLLGPYRKIKENYKPLGMNAGDFDLVKASDGKAYYYFERVHSELICADLKEDYCGLTGYYSTHFPRLGPPFVREATAHFMRKGKHYLVTSGTTGYFPNPTEVAVGDSWHGPYIVQGYLHRGDKSQTSFHSQISCVFRVEGKEELFIAVADRWLPERMDASYEVYGRAFEKRFCEGISLEDLPETERIYFQDSAVNTSVSEYIWLPIRFEGERAYIEWMDEWRLEDFS